MKLSLVGISHHVAPVELRERVALPFDRAVELARSLGDAVCLSTCNRTELYLAGERDERALATLEEIAGEPLGPVAYRMHDEAAAVHLFRVSAGLDSLVPGESEILGQVRAAYEGASVGPLLDRVFRQALQLGKRVRSETAIGESPASVPAAAAALAEQVFGDLAGRRVLLIGAGRIGELAAGSLSARGASIAYVVNRSPEAAATLAARFGAEPLAWDELAVEARRGRRRARLDERARLRRRRPPTCRRAGASRSSSSTSPSRATSTRPCTSSTAATSTTSTTSRRSWPRRSPAAASRRRAPRSSWSRRRRASASGRPRSRSCRRSPRCARAPRRSARPSSRSSATCPRTSAARIESVTAQILNKLLHLPTVRMKEAALAADGAAYAEAVRHLFGLEEKR